MKILCVSGNYQNFREPVETSSKLVFYMKPETALIRENFPFFIPAFSDKPCAEAGLVIRICKVGENIPVRFAHTYYDSVSVAMNFFAADLLDTLKANGHPWEAARSFDGSFPTGKFISIGKAGLSGEITYSFWRNKVEAGEATSAGMILNFPEIVAGLSRYVMLKTGDLIYTGSGIQAIDVQAGDALEARLQGQSVLKVSIK